MADAIQDVVDPTIQSDQTENMMYVLKGEINLEEARGGLLVAIAYVENHSTIDRDLSDILKQVLVQIETHSVQCMSNTLYGCSDEDHDGDSDTKSTTTIIEDGSYVCTNVIDSNNITDSDIQYVKSNDVHPNEIVAAITNGVEYTCMSDSDVEHTHAINTNVEHLDVCDQVNSVDEQVTSMNHAAVDDPSANIFTVLVDYESTEVIHHNNSVKQKECSELAIAIEPIVESIISSIDASLQPQDNHKIVTDSNNLKPKILSTGEKHYTASSVKKEVRLHPRKKCHPCPLCGKLFPYISHWKLHMKTHGTVREHACTICGKSFTFAGNCKQHMLIHSNEKNFTCSVCGKGYTSGNSLRKHTRTHVIDKPFSCPTCYKKFAHTTDYKRHVQSHTGNKPFLCTVCGKAVTSSTSLKRHIMTHSGDKPFSCKTCQKSFTCSSHLKQHMLQHSGVKPHSCTLCDKKFYLLGDLNVHMLTHSGEQSYSCTHCGKKFTHASSCKRHLLTHTGEKPHACSICQKAFTRLAVLREHMLIHSDQTSYACSECGMTFKHINSCRRHIRTHTAVKRKPAKNKNPSTKQ